MGARELRRPGIWSRDAVAGFCPSVNSAAIRLGMTVGLDKVVAAARELGWTLRWRSAEHGPGYERGEPARPHRSLCFGSRRASELEPWGIAAFGPESSGLSSLGAADRAPRCHHREMTPLLQDVVERDRTGAAARTAWPPRKPAPARIIATLGSSVSTRPGGGSVGRQ